MPELPDVTVYIEALEKRIVGQPLQAVRIASPSLLKTARPPIRSAEGRKVLRLRRIGKRIAIGLEGDLWLVLHLMIAGRLHWRERGAKLARKVAHAGFDFSDGTLVLTEFGPKKRASLHVVEARPALRRTIRAASRCFVPTSMRSARRWLKRTIRSSGHSPTRAGSAASATPTRTRSCTRRACRRSP